METPTAWSVIQSPFSLGLQETLMFEGYSWYRKAAQACAHFFPCKFNITKALKNISLLHLLQEAYLHEIVDEAVSKPSHSLDFKRSLRWLPTPHKQMSSEAHSAWTLPLDDISPPGDDVHASHYPAHILSSVIIITVINTGSVTGHLHLASSEKFILTLRIGVKCVLCRCA